uniref:UDP-glucuronosyltransferase n=1 Tax=Toxocara canis TaxID=6265 RepID=A0A183U1L9_TOXCA
LFQTVQWFGMPHLRQIGVSDFAWHRYFHDASAILSDAMINIGHPTAEGTEMTNVGSVCATPFGTLSNDVDNFLNDPLSKGTIYVAFGSHVNWITSPTLLKAAFLDALAELTDYRIIFAYNAPVGNMPRHIKVFQFAPQKEILNHNRTKLFISHGGLKSLKESICAGVPLVLMPIFAEQAHNTFLARQLGIAETLNKVQVTKEIVISQLKKVLNDSKYVGSVRKVKRLFLDRVIPAMDHSVFITERILRHHPKQIYFKRKGINLMWIQHLYIDLAILLFCALFIVNY